MGLQIRCYVEGQQKYVDLYGQEDVKINVSFAEIQDIRKKNSAYSQEFRVPGSKNNNEIFNYFFDINSVYTDFNAKLKFEADMLYDGYELFNGFIRLNSVTIDKTEKIYSVTYYTAIGDLAANIGDKALCNIDTSSLNISANTASNIFSIFDDPSLQPPSVVRATNPTYAQFLDQFYAGWDNPISQGNVQFYLTYRGYDYTGSTTGTIIDIDYEETPILSFSGATRFFDSYDSPVPVSYLMPSVRVKTLYELICNQAGYNIQSDFFETDYFKRYYLPLSFNTEQPNMAQAQKLDYYFENLSGQSLGTTGVTFTDGPGFFQTRRLINPREIIKDNLGFNPVDPNLLGGIGTYLFTLPYGVVDWRYRMVTQYTGSSTSSLIVTVSNIVFCRFVNWDPITSTIQGVVIDGDQINAYAGTGTGQTILTNSDTGSSTPASPLPDNGLYFLAFLPISAANTILREMTFSASTQTLRLPETLELYKEMSCDQKQIDYISDINRMFNLVVVEHPFKPKTVIIEPMVNYIGKGELLDWTDKVDYDSPQTLFPTTTVINGSIFASNKKDNDFINAEFFKRSNLIFGEQLIDLGVEYKNEQVDLTQKLGQNTDYYLNASGDTNIALSCFFITKENNVDGVTNFEFRPFRSLPRVAFAGVPIPTGNTGQNVIFIQTQTPDPQSNTPTPLGTIWNLNRLTTYPFAIEGFSHYTTYNPSDVFTPDEVVYPSLESQYDRYYYDYIQDLISPENKIYTCKMYLTPWDVSNLYFNEVIFIKNAKFRINKISNLSLIRPGVCDVELVKLTRDYTPTPTLFFDLVSCDDPCDIIHTHTDLIFPIFAFENNFIDVTVNWSDEGDPTIIRYKVIRSNFNPDYTYEKVYFTPGREYIEFGPSEDAFAQFMYKTYDTCDMPDPDYKLDVTNEIENPFDPDTCYYFNIVNQSPNANTFTYLDCSGNTQTGSVIGFGTFGICAINGSIQGENIEICNLTGVPCTPPFPSVTPSATPPFTPATPTVTPTLTRTPTPTPSGFECRFQTQILVTVEGWIWYNLCGNETPNVVYVRPGYTTINACITVGSLVPASIFPQAVFTITNPGIPC